MEIKTTKVRLLAALCLLPLCATSLCLPGLQYWSNDSESCINCSRCDSLAKQVVLRPCQAHADTVCGPISDLNIDWSWLKHASKHHDKHLVDDVDSMFTVENKHHSKKAHKHHTSTLNDDIENTPIHHSVLDDEVETVPAITHHSNHKGHKHSHKIIDDDDEIVFEKKHNKKHHISSESSSKENFDLSSEHKNYHKLPPSPPLKSTDALEKEWKEWLIQSKNRLQHRKDDLLKNLHRESPYNDNHHTSHKLNHPSSNSFDDFDGEIFHHSAHHKDHKKHFSPLDLEIFDRLLNHHDHQKHEERLSLSHLLNPENRHSNLLDMMKSEDKKEEKQSLGASDLSYPMDSFDFRSIVPTHRLFLGEPSTISEIMDQDFSEESEDDEDETQKEGKTLWQTEEDSSVIAVPFTATERFVWDWQAVALASAVTACLLFFAVVTVYSILHARQWKRLKTNFDTDPEELSVKVGLMQSAANTNQYLENLLENKKKSSNIYTQKRPLS